MRLALALLLVFAVGLTACNGGGDGSVAPTTAGPDAEGPTATIPREGIPATLEGAGGPPPVEGEATVTASGLRIIDVEVGTGEAVGPGQLVAVHYTGWLPDGTQFIRTRDFGPPDEFTLGSGEMIQGFDEGVTGMRAGGKRWLIIPPELAQGVFPGSVPPDTDLIFEVELIDFR